MQLAIFDLGDVVFRIDPLAPFRAWERFGAGPAHDLAAWLEADPRCHEFERGELSNHAFYCHVRDMLGLGEMSYDDFVADWNSIYREPHQEVVACLERLVTRIPCVALTNTNAVHCQAWPDLYDDILRHFDRLYVSSQIGLRKPDHACYQHVLADMRVEPAAAIFFDDKPVNVEGAAALGVSAILVDEPSAVVRALEARGLI